MCATCNNDETPRPEPTCPCGNRTTICDECGFGQLDCPSDGDLPTGYEADDERPYGWDVPEDEYPDW